MEEVEKIEVTYVSDDGWFTIRITKLDGTVISFPSRSKFTNQYYVSKKK
jgi:hypothetical protein